MKGHGPACFFSEAPAVVSFVGAGEKTDGSVSWVASRELAFGRATYTEEQEGDAQQKSELVSV